MAGSARRPGFQNTLIIPSQLEISISLIRKDWHFWLISLHCTLSLKLSVPVVRTYGNHKGYHSCKTKHAHAHTSWGLCGSHVSSVKDKRAFVTNTSLHYNEFHANDLKANHIIFFFPLVQSVLVNWLEKVPYINIFLFLNSSKQTLFNQYSTELLDRLWKHDETVHMYTCVCTQMYLARQ